MGNEIEVKWVLSCNDEDIRKKLGYEKLLGKGKVSIKMQIKASSFSKKAKEKIKASDGILEEENVK